MTPPCGQIVVAFLIPEHRPGPARLRHDGFHRFSLFRFRRVADGAVKRRDLEDLQSRRMVPGVEILQRLPQRVEGDGAKGDQDDFAPVAISISHHWIELAQTGPQFEREVLLRFEGPAPVGDKFTHKPVETVWSGMTMLEFCEKTEALHGIGEIERLTVAVIKHSRVAGAGKLAVVLVDPGADARECVVSLRWVAQRLVGSMPD